MCDVMKITDFDFVVWDFNGTLLDDVAIGVESVNTLLRRRGLPPIPSHERYREIFGFPVEDYYRRAGFDLDNEPYDAVAHEWLAEYRLRERQAPLRRGAAELIGFFDERHIPQAVLSATESRMLEEQLRDLGIAERFAEICGNDNIYAVSKTETAVRWTNMRNRGRILMIGDTPHDAETARAAGFVPALVMGGHSTESKLKATNEAVFTSFEELKETLLQ